MLAAKTHKMQTNTASTVAKDPTKPASKIGPSPAHSLPAPQPDGRPAPARSLPVPHLTAARIRSLPAVGVGRGPGHLDQAARGDHGISAGSRSMRRRVRQVRSPVRHGLATISPRFVFKASLPPRSRQHPRRKKANNRSVNSRTG